MNESSRSSSAHGLTIFTYIYMIACFEACKYFQIMMILLDNNALIATLAMTSSVLVHLELEAFT